MIFTDWLVLIGTLAFIVIYGIWKTKGSKNIESYLLGDNQMKWGTICLSIMGTQASAITFLSTPGQAYQDGMRFVQFYLGLPLAMIVISITFVPIYSKLKVFTAYEYLESRFDFKTRTLAALLFLIQRGLSTGITIYAPAIVLSTILGWNLLATNIIIGTLVILYTVSGGTKAVSITQEQQMGVILTGMLLAGYMVIKMLPANIHFSDAVNIAGAYGKMNVVDFSFNWNDRYNFWSGIIGGFFLALSYFGTDQSQVSRFLSGKSIAESRMGLLFNGVLKIPMQFSILLLGCLVFVFYQFYQPPVFFNQVEIQKLKASSYSNDYAILEKEHNANFVNKKKVLNQLVTSLQNNDKNATNEIKETLLQLDKKEKAIKERASKLITKRDPSASAKDTDYIFINFIMENLPHGMIGLLLAVMFSAAMSSTASGLNSLASTTCVDIYMRSIKKNKNPKHYVNASKLFTVAWGIVAIIFAIIASKLENLIQAVNILGSLFYGTILGIFLAAFYFKKLKSTPVFLGALMAEIFVIALYIGSGIGFLWFNLIGCVLVILFAYIIQLLLNEKSESGVSS